MSLSSHPAPRLPSYRLATNEYGIEQLGARRTQVYHQVAANFERNLSRGVAAFNLHVLNADGPARSSRSCEER
jgi:hypothetical protein